MLPESRVRVVNARAFEQCRVPSDGRLLVTHIQRQALARILSTIHIHREVGQIVMAEIIRIRILEPRNSVFFTMVNSRHFASTPNTALLIGNASGPPANVKVLSSTLVKLYLAKNPLLRASL